MLRCGSPASSCKFLLLGGAYLVSAAVVPEKKEGHSDRGGLQRFIKSAACAEVEILEPAPESIIMDSLWVLVVKCKLKKSLKK